MEVGSSTGLSNIIKASSPVYTRLVMCGISSIEPLADSYRRLIGHWTQKQINHRWPLIGTTVFGDFIRYDDHLSMDIPIFLILWVNYQ